MKITKHKVISFDYTMKNDDGLALESTKETQPLTGIHGVGHMIPGLERALEGRMAGDNFQVIIEPADAYEDYDKELIQVVPRDMVEGVENIEVGMVFQAQTDEGTAHSVRVIAVDGENITIDANHPLAGERLHFDIDVRSVREATDDELEHGHVHNDQDGCQ